MCWCCQQRSTEVSMLARIACPVCKITTDKKETNKETRSPHPRLFAVTYYQPQASQIANFSSSSSWFLCWWAGPWSSGALFGFFEYFLTSEVRPEWCQVSRYFPSVLLFQLSGVHAKLVVPLCDLNLIHGLFCDVISVCESLCFSCFSPQVSSTSSSDHKSTSLTAPRNMLSQLRKRIPGLDVETCGSMNTHQETTCKPWLDETTRRRKTTVCLIYQWSRLIQIKT